MSRSDRRYGYFRCSSCNGTWESSHVYIESRTPEEEYYMQDCKKCNVACAPYRVERIRCSSCGQTTCVCSDKRHTDTNKPHRQDLCHKCKSGRPCANSY